MLIVEKRADKATGEGRRDGATRTLGSKNI